VSYYKEQCSESILDKIETNISQKVQIIETTENSESIVYKWKIPIKIIIFLQSLLKDKTKGNVLPWEYIKTLIYKVYEFVIDSQKAGSFNEASVTLDEALIIYLLCENQHKRIAEQKLLDIICSLKYYTPIWYRAKCFSYLCGFLQKTTMTDAEFENSSAQERKYFLWCLNSLQFYRLDLVEKSNGYTLLKKDKIDLISQAVLFWMDDTEKNAFHKRMRDTINRNKEGSFADVDNYLWNFLIKFQNTENAIFNDIESNFNNMIAKQMGIFTQSEFQELFEVKVIKTFIPSKLMISKVMMSCLLDSKDGLTISYSHLRKYIKAFGMQSPTSNSMFNSNRIFEREEIKQEKPKSNIELLGVQAYNASTVISKIFSVLREIKGRLLSTDNNPVSMEQLIAYIKIAFDALEIN
jgi:hypothetical protein